MTRHFLTLQLCDTPLAFGKLHGMLRSRRITFAISVGQGSVNSTVFATIAIDAPRERAEQIARYCRRLVDVHEVAVASEDEIAAHESALVEVLVPDADLAEVLAGHPVVRVVTPGPLLVVLAIAGSSAEVSSALAALAPFVVHRMIHPAPISLVPFPPMHPARPEESC